MKTSILICAFAAIVGCSNPKREDTILAKLPGGPQLTVSGKPFVILGGELGNSSASCTEDIDRIFPQMRALNINTLLVPAYWDLMEPEEGRFDFTLVDHTLKAAAQNNLRLVYLWFGAWKNSMSCYAPEWFKRDTKRFPRAQTRAGKPLEIASAFSENVFRADSSAFTAFLKHLKKHDRTGRVIMLQIENEIGMLESPRDCSPVADSLFGIFAAHQRQSYIQATNEADKTSATDTLEERFMASHYAAYVERLAKTARQWFPEMPLYVNAAMNSRGRKPGEYPSAGPLPHLFDVWKTNAPTLSFCSPDIYDTDFRHWASGYATGDNTLFIPEMRLCDANGAQAFYAIGEYKAIGVSPFSIENINEKASLKQAYDLLENLTPTIAEAKRYGKWMRGILFDETDDKQAAATFRCGNLLIEVKHFFTLPWDPRATDGTKWPTTGGLIIETAPDEYLIAGNGIVVTFSKGNSNGPESELGEDGFAVAGGNDTNPAAPPKWEGGRVGIANCDEVRALADGSLKRVRRLNGDEDHQGRHIRIGVDDWKALRVRLYSY